MKTVFRKATKDCDEAIALIHEAVYGYMENFADNEPKTIYIPLSLCKLEILAGSWRENVFTFLSTAMVGVNLKKHDNDVVIAMGDRGTFAVALESNA